MGQDHMANYTPTSLSPSIQIPTTLTVSCKNRPIKRFSSFTDTRHFQMHPDLFAVLPSGVVGKNDLRRRMKSSCHIKRKRSIFEWQSQNHATNNCIAFAQNSALSSSILAHRFRFSNGFKMSSSSEAAATNSLDLIALYDCLQPTVSTHVCPYLHLLHFDFCQA